jgi:3-hydroxyisobutyrate dehydrogenase
MQVAVIGLGAMGLAMAERLAERGEAVQGWDRDPARRRAAEAAGVAVAEDAATGAEVVILSLPDDVAVRAVAATLPAAGMMAGGVVVDTSTVAPETPRALAPGFAATGLAWLDAPVSGGPHGARAGRLTMMVGGEAEALACAMPALEAIAAKVVHVGPSGAGAVAKLANNLLVAAHLLTAAEALRLARCAGVDAEAALSVINTASGRSGGGVGQNPRRGPPPRDRGELPALDPARQLRLRLHRRADAQGRAACARTGAPRRRQRHADGGGGAAVAAGQRGGGRRGFQPRRGRALAGGLRR